MIPKTRKVLSNFEAKVLPFTVMVLLIVAGLSAVFFVMPSDIVKADEGTVSTMTATLNEGLKNLGSTYDTTDEIFYIFGGYDKSQGEDTIQAFNPSNDSCWVIGETLTNDLRNFGCFYYATGDCSFILGGKSDANGKEDGIHKFWHSNNTIQTLSQTLPEAAITNHLVYDSSAEIAYIVGVNTDGGNYSYIWSFDPSDASTTNLSSTQNVYLPASRRNSFVAWDSDNTRGYILCGKDASNTLQDDIYAFDDNDTGTFECWDTGYTFTHTMQAGKAIYNNVNQTIITFGGNTGSHTDDIIRYTVSTGSSTIVGNLTTEASFLSAGWNSSSGKAYIFGGDNGGSLNNEIWEYDPPGEPATPSEDASEFGIVDSYLDNGDVTWSGQADTTTYSNETAGVGNNVTIYTDVNISENCTDIFVDLSDDTAFGGSDEVDFDSSSGNSEMYLQVSNDSDWDSSDWLQFTDANGYNISLNDSWASISNDPNPFVLRNYSDVNYTFTCRFKLVLGAGISDGIYDIANTAWKIIHKYETTW